MRRIISAAVLAMFAVTGGHAQERAVDGALGGLAGAVVLGPIGLIGGALIGATAGPGISQQWGMSGHHRRARRQRPRHA